MHDFASSGTSSADKVYLTLNAQNHRWGSGMDE